MVCRDLATYFLFWLKIDVKKSSFFMGSSSISYVHDKRKYNGVLNIIVLTVLKVSKMLLRIIKLGLSQTTLQLRAFL
jgi:hypothetical protein